MSGIDWWGDPSNASQEIESCVRQLLVVPRPEKTLFFDVIVENARSWKTALGFERVKHENAATGVHTTIVEQIKVQVPHRLE